MTLALAYDSIYSRTAPSDEVSQIAASTCGNEVLPKRGCTTILSKCQLTRIRRCLAVHQENHANGGIILDVGCGTGGFTHWLSCVAQDRVRGVDFSRTAIQIARRNCLDNLRCEFGFGDFCRLPLPDRSVYAAFSIDALYLADSAERAISEVNRVLRSSALLYMTLYTGPDRRSSLASWLTLLRKSQFKLQVRNISRFWRKQMYLRHWLRCECLSKIRRRSRWGDAELAVSAAFLGNSRQTALIPQIRRYEILARLG